MPEVVAKEEGWPLTAPTELAGFRDESADTSRFALTLIEDVMAMLYRLQWRFITSLPRASQSSTVLSSGLVTEAFLLLIKDDGGGVFTLGVFMDFDFLSLPMIDYEIY